jgi:preprotein translocase subunit SecD
MRDVSSYWLRILAALSAALLTQACMNVSIDVPTSSLAAGPTTAPPIDCLRGEYRSLPIDGAPVSSDALDAIVVIIGNRLVDYGLLQSQFRVESQGADRVVVQLAPVGDEQALRHLITSTGRLEFFGVPSDRSDEVQQGMPIPADLPLIFDGSHIETASPGFTSGGQLAVDVTFDAEGARLFDDFAAEHLGEQFAIVLDAVVVTAPVIQAAGFDGKAQISGSFETDAEVAELLTVLRSGALPNPLEEVTFGPC